MRLLLWPLQGPVKPWVGASACYRSRGSLPPQSMARQLQSAPQALGLHGPHTCFPAYPASPRLGGRRGSSHLGRGPAGLAIRVQQQKEAEVCSLQTQS